MGKMKETAPKGKKNPSTGMVPAGDDDRTAREQAIMALTQLDAAGYEALTEQAEGVLHSLDVVEKDDLIGVAFHVVDCKMNESNDYVDKKTGEKSTFMFVTVLCEADRAVRAFTDGGLGIRGQIVPGTIDPRNPKTWVYCSKGLKKDEYTNREGQPSVTFRLDNAPAKDAPSRANARNGRAQARA